MNNLLQILEPSFCCRLLYGSVIQGGPKKPVITGVIRPISRVITPGKPIYKFIYRGYNSFYN